MDYDELLEDADENDVTVYEHYPFESDRIKGLYCDNNIALSSAIETTAERSCILAEELGHYYTSSGNILDPDSVENKKQELRARMWAYDHQIGLAGIAAAYSHGCKSLHDMADFLNVSEQFMSEAIEAYRSKYGAMASVGDYTIYFEPRFAVLRIMKVN